MSVWNVTSARRVLLAYKHNAKARDAAPGALAAMEAALAVALVQERKSRQRCEEARGRKDRNTKALCKRHGEDFKVLMDVRDVVERLYRMILSNSKTR